MATYQAYASSSAITRYNSPNANDHTTAQFQEAHTSDALYINGFGSFPEEYKHRQINGVSIMAYVSGAVYNLSIIADLISDAFNANSITQNNAPDIIYNSKTLTLSSNDPGYAYASWNTIYTASARDLAKSLMLYGVRLSIDLGSATSVAKINTARASSGKPYLLVVMSDEDMTAKVYVSDKKSGFLNRKIDNTFSWYTNVSGYYSWDDDDNQQTAAVFEWKTAEDGAVTSVNLTTESAYTIPANTIPAGDFYWRVTGTNGFGSNTTEWYKLNTAEVLSNCTLYTPNNGKLDASIENRITWRHIISTGSDPTGADIEIKLTSASAWSSFAHVDGANTYYTIPADTLSDANYNFRARTYNSDEAAGSWSNVITVSVMAAPGEPSVNSFNSIKPLITWGADTHVSYEVEIDGVSSGEVFGAENSYQWPDYLTAGSHDIRVRVKNRWSLWSKWGTAIGSSSYDGPAITIAITSGADTVVSWTSSGDYEYVLFKNSKEVYRGELKRYNDILAEYGDDYYVIGIGEQNAITETVSARPTWTDFRIASVTEKSWLVIKYAAVQYAEQVHAKTRTATYRHFTGSEYPSIELSTFRDETFSFQCAFADREDIKAFEKLIGDIVCVKTQHGETIIGGLVSATVSKIDMYTVFKADIRRIDYSGVNGA